ncbi:MAG: hypothetical protein AAGN15_15010 [Cyanobacteria bacterium J06581_3]
MNTGTRDTNKLSYSHRLTPQQLIRKTIRYLNVSEHIKNAEYKKIAESYCIAGNYQRIYLVHIRKTGGTSINNMFLSVSGIPHESIRQQLIAAPRHRIVHSGYVFVGWNRDLINKGDYYYGFSHIPLHELNLPPKTFTLTCFRDPAKRLLSHYKMLMGYKINNVDHPCMLEEGKWLGTSFREFLDRIPREHLLNQLYMFSSRFDINEAVEAVRDLSYYMFTETLDQGIAKLNERLSMELIPFHSHKSNYQFEVSDSDFAYLTKLLEEEYIFLAKLKAI